MSRPLRLTAIILGVIVCLLLAAYVAAVQLVDQKGLVTRALAAVEEKTGYRVTVNGPVDLRFFPTVALTARDLETAIPGEQEPARLAELLIDARLWPLLRGELAVDRVELADARIRLSGQDYLLRVDSLALKGLGQAGVESLDCKAWVGDGQGREEVRLELTGSLFLSAEKGHKLDIMGMIAGSALKIQLSAASNADGGLESVSGDIRTGVVDLSPWLGGTGAAKTGGTARSGSGRGASQGALDRDAPGKAASPWPQTDVSIACEAILVQGLRFEKVQARLTGGGEQLFLDPVTAQLAGGRITAIASYDRYGNYAAGVTALDCSLPGLLGTGLFKRGTVKAEAALEGNARDGAAGIGGTAALNITDGFIASFAIIPHDVEGIKPLVQDVSIRDAAFAWQISKGLARSTQGVVRATALDATADGKVDLAAKRVDYLLNIRPVKFVSIPATVSGPLASPRYRVDLEGLIRNMAAQGIDLPKNLGKELEKLERRAKGVRGLLRDRKR